MFDASVIICTHNPRPNYLERTVRALREQTVSDDRWELIVVDNGSSRPVADVTDLSWHPHGRHVLEPELGLASARQRGIAVSTGRLLIFVDDDNVLAPDYLSQALRIEADCSFLGAWGSGSIALEFEVEPAGHLQPLLPWLALRDVKLPVWSNVISCTDAAPIGAGLCVRRPIGEAYRELCRTSSIQIPGRKGKSLGGHEDVEICYLACKAGLGMGMFPELKILHLIAKERVTDEHFVKLVENLMLSKFMLAHKWGEALPKSPFSVRGAARVALSLLTRDGFDRRLYLAELRALIAVRRLASE
jgi:glycosyltransferase involved in cell wall biosynthesis